MFTALLLVSTAFAHPLTGEVEGPPPNQAEEADLRLAPSRRSPGLAIGVHGGRWGGDYGSGFRVEAPLFAYGGVRVHQITQYANTAPAGESGYAPTLGAGAQLFLRTPIIAERYRVRMGGGPLAAIDGNHDWALGGAGFVGAEALVSERTTLTFEVGGAGGSGALDRAEGLSIMGGVSFYLGQR